MSEESGGFPPPSASGRAPAPTRPETGDSPKVRFCTKPELTVTDGGLQVKFDLVNAGPTRIGFRFDVRIDGEVVEIARPELSLSSADGMQAIRLDVPLDTPLSCKVTVTVKGSGGETLAIGSNGVSVTVQGAHGVRLAVGKKGVAVGWGKVLIAGVAVSLGTAFTLDKFRPDPDPSDVGSIEITENSSGDLGDPDSADAVEDASTTTSTPAAEGADVVQIDVPGSLTVPRWLAFSTPGESTDPKPIVELASMPVHRLSDGGDVTLELDVARVAPSSVASDAGFASAQVLGVALTYEGRTAFVGEIVVPSALRAGQLTTDRVFESDPVGAVLDIFPGGGTTDYVCFDDTDGDEVFDRDGDRPEPIIGTWTSTGSPAAFVVAVETVATPEGVGHRAHVAMATQWQFVDQDQAGSAQGSEPTVERDRSRCPDEPIAITGWSVGTGTTVEDWEQWASAALASLEGAANGSASGPDSANDSGDADAPADAEDVGTVYVPEPQVGSLQLGHEGERVLTLQTGLVAAGYLDEAEVDGLYGPATHDAVIAFQRDSGLEADGLAGPRTHAALGLPYESITGEGAGG